MSKQLIDHEALAQELEVSCAVLRCGIALWCNVVMWSVEHTKPVGTSVSRARGGEGINRVIVGAQ